MSAFQAWWAPTEMVMPVTQTGANRDVCFR